GRAGSRLGVVGGAAAMESATIRVAPAANRGGAASEGAAGNAAASADCSWEAEAKRSLGFLAIARRMGLSSSIGMGASCLHGGTAALVRDIAMSSAMLSAANGGRPQTIS